MHELNGKINLVVCQKSKVQDWIDHLFQNYDDWIVYDGTKKECLQRFLDYDGDSKQVVVINYDLIFRRPKLVNYPIDTLVLDESSLIQNEKAKRSKAVLKIDTKNVVLLSGTPTGGKYERLWSQAKLLGWNISKELFYKQYIDFEWVESDGFWHQEIKGYKNVDRMIRKFKQHGAHFLKTDEVMDLPTQTFIPINVPTTKEYWKFKKNKYLQLGEKELIGDTALTAMLYERQLCGQYNPQKLQAFHDLVESTDDRLIVFYNFTAEMEAMRDICKELEKPCGVINGETKDDGPYKKFSNSITLVQYQAGAMGLNLQKANKIVYYTPPLSCELWMQSLKRIHRIGQERPCFYYQLICRNSIEERIYNSLQQGVDYTERLFLKDC